GVQNMRKRRRETAPNWRNTGANLRNAGLPLGSTNLPGKPPASKEAKRRYLLAVADSAQ
ncbi:hypothetical protein HAX54_000400, partial [Datura stramonium]|nr:hypothetical protein [Datura stramonium]